MIITAVDLCLSVNKQLLRTIITVLGVLKGRTR